MCFSPADDKGSSAGQASARSPGGAGAVNIHRTMTWSLQLRECLSVLRCAVLCYAVCLPAHWLPNAAAAAIPHAGSWPLPLRHDYTISGEEKE